MKSALNEIIEKNERKDFKEYITLLVKQDQKFFLRNEILYRFRSYCDDKDEPQEFQDWRWSPRSSF
jgi:predicted ATPase